MVVIPVSVIASTINTVHGRSPLTQLVTALLFTVLTK